MENIRYADELVQEYLTFRGFSSTVRALEHDMMEDRSRGFQVREIVRELQGLLARKQIDGALRYWDILHRWFTRRVDVDVDEMSGSLRTSLQKLFLVTCYSDAQRQGRPDTSGIEDFFKDKGELLKDDPAWKDWFALPFVRGAESQAPFSVYFSKQWQESFFQSLRNFFSSVFHQMHILPAPCSPLPRLLNFNSFRLEEARLMEEVDALKRTCDSLREALNVKMQSHSSSRSQSPTMLEDRPVLERGLSDDSFPPRGHTSDVRRKAAQSPDGYQADVMFRSNIKEKPDDLFSTQVQTVYPSHQGCLTRARFSVSGDQVACSSSDGIVSVWDTDSPRSARYLHCSAAVCSLDWDMKAESLLAVGTTSGMVRLWDTRRIKVTHEFCASAQYPRITDLTLSPTSRHMVTACSDPSSPGVSGSQSGQLLAWSMKRIGDGIPEMSFVLSPEAINVKSIKFNHNGNMLIAGCSDGMIRVFDMNQPDAIMGWKAHDGPVSCVRYASHETSLFSVGVDGQLKEWSVHKCGHVVKEFNFPSFLGDPGSPIEVMTPNRGRGVLLTHLVRANTPQTPKGGVGGVSTPVLPSPEGLTRDHTHISPPAPGLGGWTVGAHAGRLLRGRQPGGEDEEDEDEEEEDEDEDEDSRAHIAGSPGRVPEPEILRSPMGGHAHMGEGPVSSPFVDPVDLRSPPSGVSDSGTRAGRSRSVRTTPTATGPSSMSPQFSAEVLVPSDRGTPEHYTTGAMSMFVRPELAVSPEVNYFVTSNPHFLYQVDRSDAVQVLGDAGLGRNSVVTSVDWHPTQNCIVAGYADSSVRVTNFLRRSSSTASSSSSPTAGM